MDPNYCETSSVISTVSNNNSLAMECATTRQKILLEQLADLKTELSKKCICDKTISRIKSRQETLNEDLVSAIRLLEDKLAEKQNEVNVLKEQTRMLSDECIASEKKLNEYAIKLESNLDTATKRANEANQLVKELAKTQERLADDIKLHLSNQQTLEEHIGRLKSEAKGYEKKEQKLIAQIGEQEQSLVNAAKENVDLLNQITKLNIDICKLNEDADKKEKTNKELQGKMKNEIKNLESERCDSREEIAKLKSDLENISIQYEINGEQINHPIYSDSRTGNENLESNLSDKNDEFGCTEILKGLTAGLNKFVCEVHILHARYSSVQAKSKTNVSKSATTLLTDMSAVSDIQANDQPGANMRLPEPENDVKNTSVHKRVGTSPDDENQANKKIKWEENVSNICPNVIIKVSLHGITSSPPSPTFDIDDDAEIYWEHFKRNPIYRRYSPYSDDMKTHGAAAQDSTNLYKCVCGYRFHTKGSLHQHVTAMSDPNWKFTCEKCSEQFYYNRLLDKHKNRITDCKITKDARESKRRAQKLERESSNDVVET